MFSKIVLNSDALISNLQHVKSVCGGKICFMVKANAYGHGVKEIVKIAQEEVDYFGVSNQKEGEEVRALTDKKVVVFGRCEDYFSCMAQKIGFALCSLEQAKEIVEIYKNSYVRPLMHLCVNSGMNRYGVKDEKECKKIISLLKKNGLELEGIYTHFSSLTTDEQYSQKQWEIFQSFVSLLPKEWKTISHIGGGGTLFKSMQADMHRVGLYGYGYGCDGVKSVLKVESKIVDIQKVKKGEHIGYLCGFTAEEDMTVATIPLGYGDGFPRKLSNKLEVKIAGQNAKVVGNVCMDAFMVDVSDIKCKEGDCVNVFENASFIAPLIESTEYEVLTNFSKFRGDRIIR